tara:strand:- start:787 stop:1137 length:351 start_codon:yes stop_codon:yes gene_type:complete
MIYQGESGSINFFFKNRLIVSRPLTKEITVDYYENSRDNVIREAMEAGWSLKRQINFHKGFLKTCRYTDMIKQPDEDDLNIILITGLILIKLRQIDPDGDREGLLIMGPKKKKSSL